MIHTRGSLNTNSKHESRLPTGTEKKGDTVMGLWGYGTRPQSEIPWTTVTSNMCPLSRSSIAILGDNSLLAYCILNFSSGPPAGQLISWSTEFKFVLPLGQFILFVHYTPYTVQYTDKANSLLTMPMQDSKNQSNKNSQHKGKFENRTGRRAISP